MASRVRGFASSFLPRVFAQEEERIGIISKDEIDNEYTDPTLGSSISLQELSNGRLPGDELATDTSKPVEMSEPEAKSQQSRINAWQAGWNITNAIQGMFIVSLPFAVLRGGYWAVFAMILTAYITCYTGKIVVWCLYEEDEYGQKLRVRDSYVAIAETVWGKRIGGRIVHVAQLCELLMTCVLYLVLTGDLLIAAFPYAPIPLKSWIMIGSIFVLPCSFLKTYKAVSWLSLWNTVAHFFINAIVICYCLSFAPNWYWSKVTFKVNIYGFPVVLGIIVFSYTSQIFVASLEGAMRDRSQFNRMMNWTHISAAIAKALFGYICFLTYGTKTKEIITNNLPNNAFKVIVNLFLVVKSILSYPLPYFAVVDLLEVTFFDRPDKKYFPSCFHRDGDFKAWGLFLRLLLVLATVLMAIYIPHFALLMGFIGNFTGTMLSFVWPCVFHMKLRWQQLRWYVIAADCIIIVMGIICGIIGMYSSGILLSKAIRNGTFLKPLIRP